MKLLTIRLPSNKTIGHLITFKGSTSVFDNSQNCLLRKQVVLRISPASIGIVLVTVSCGLIVFAMISMILGFLELIFGVAVSDSDFYVESAILGAIGGMVWGMAGGFLTICFATCKLWQPAFVGEQFRQSGGQPLTGR